MRICGFIVKRYNGCHVPDFGGRYKKIILIIVCMESICVSYVVYDMGLSGFKLFFDAFMLGMITGGLTYAGICDLLFREVYDFIWWIILPCASVLFVMTCNNAAILADLAVFFVMQQLIFAKFYGRADCHAFCTCAVTAAFFNHRLEDYLVHMILSFILLSIVQFFKHNIGKNGSLIIKKPFIPYIVFSFYAVLLKGGLW